MACHHSKAALGAVILKTTGDILRMWNVRTRDNGVMHACITRSPHNPERTCIEVFFGAELYRVIVAGGERIEHFTLEVTGDEWPEIEALYTTKQTDGLQMLSRTTANHLRSGPPVDDDVLDGWRLNDIEARECLDASPSRGKKTCCHPNLNYIAVGNALYKQV